MFYRRKINVCNPNNPSNVKHYLSNIIRKVYSVYFLSISRIIKLINHTVMIKWSNDEFPTPVSKQYLLY